MNPIFKTNVANFKSLKVSSLLIKLTKFNKIEINIPETAIIFIKSKINIKISCDNSYLSIAKFLLEQQYSPERTLSCSLLFINRTFHSPQDVAMPYPTEKPTSTPIYLQEFFM